MDLISVECPSCGAKLPPREPSGNITCEYCGSSFSIGQAKKAQTQAGVVVDPQELARAIVQAQQEQLAAQQPPQIQINPAPIPTPTPKQVKKAGRGCAFLSLFITLITIAGVLIPVYFVVRDVTDAVGVSFDALDRVEEAVSGAKEKAGLQRFGWDDVGGPPQITQLEGKTVIAGRIRAQGGSDGLFCALFNTDGSQRWRSENLGTYSAAYRNISCTVAGQSLVATDGDAGLRLLSLADGSERKRHGLTDLVERVCIPDPEGDAQIEPTRVWVLQIDKRASFLDLASGELSEAAADKPPAGCSRKRRSRRDEGRLLAQDLDAGVRLGQRKQAPKLDGAKVDFVLLSGESDAIAFGHTSPGTKVPYAAGFDPSSKSKDIRWQSPTPSIAKTKVRYDDIYATIVGDKLISNYGSGQEDWMLTAFDLQSGDRIWETRLRPIFAVDSIEGVIPAKTHVLVLRTSSIDVFDANTGQQTGTLGHETYDDE